MRTKLVETNKPEKYMHSIRNVDTSAAAVTIPAGTPLILNLSGTPQPPTYTNALPAGWEDGLQVVLPSTSGANAALYYYGVATIPIIYQQLGETMVHGVCQALVVRQTRSATTVSWASLASSAVSGNGLTIDTVNNAFGTITLSPVNGHSIVPTLLIDNFATMAGSATTATDTRLAVTQLVRAFVRQM